MAENPQDPKQGAAPNDAAGIDGVDGTADAANATNATNATDQAAAASTDAMPVPTGAPANMPAPTAAPVSLPAPSGAPVIADLPAPVGFPVAAAPAEPAAPAVPAAPPAPLAPPVAPAPLAAAPRSAPPAPPAPPAAEALQTTQLAPSPEPSEDAAPTLDSLFAAPETAHLTETRQPEPVPAWVGSQPTSTIPPFGAAAPGSGTIDSKAAKRRRTLAIVIIAALVLVLAGGAVATVLLLKQNAAPEAPVAEQSAAQPAPAEAPAAIEEPEAPEDEAVEEPDPRFDQPATMPGSGHAPLPGGDAKLCVFGTTNEVEFYIFDNVESSGGMTRYVGGNKALGYLELPAVPAGSGFVMTNDDGTTYNLTDTKLVVTFPNGDGFEQTVRDWQPYTCD